MRSGAVAAHSRSLPRPSEAIRHVTKDALYCAVQVFEVRAQWSRYALTQPEVVAPEQEGRFNTTELHCTEYYPAARVGA